jgi:hypothetical protein
MRILWTGAFLLVLTMSANANVTGITLKQNCDAPDMSAPARYCLAYMTGVLDTIRGLGNTGDKRIFCEPATVTGQQLLAMLRKYLADHPERLHFAASSLVADMYAETFHCDPPPTR